MKADEYLRYKLFVFLSIDFSKKTTQSVSALI